MAWKLPSSTARQVPRKQDQGCATCTHFIVNTKWFFISISDWSLETHEEYNTAGRSPRLVPGVRLNNSSWNARLLLLFRWLWSHSWSPYTSRENEGWNWYRTVYFWMNYLFFLIIQKRKLRLLITLLKNLTWWSSNTHDFNFVVQKPNFTYLQQYVEL